jgi:hypothetical protein
MPATDGAFGRIRSRVARGATARIAGSLVALVVVQLPALVVAQPGGPVERRRREIEKQLNLPKTTPPTPPPSPPVPEEPPAARETLPGTATPDRPPSTPASPAPPVFAPEIHRLVVTTCGGCHAPGAAAASSRLLLGGAPRADYEAIRRFVDSKRPADSLLITKASGQMHGGGATAPVGGRVQRRLVAWIAAGALFDAAAPGTPAPPGPPRPRPVARPPLGAPPAASAVEDVVVAPPGDQPARPAPAGVPAERPDFVATVEPILTVSCRGCHSPQGMAAASHLHISGNPTVDHAAVLAFTTPSHPPQSPLVTKAAGVQHGGGPVLPQTSEGFRALVAWIAAGAPGPEESAPPGEAPSAEASPEAPSLPPLPPAVAAHPTPGAPGGLSLPLGLQLDGRFDLNYERRGIGRDTSFAEGKSALRSYHQFLFLSRASADDPIALMVEIVSLQIWEGAFHHRFAGAPLTLVVRGGKILVPFGNDPLFHQAYGGLVGFDQKVLPAVWAQEGMSAGLVLRHEGVSLSGEAYGVRGYRLRQAAAILNLQSDFSAADDLEPGAGLRLGAAYGPLTAYYSLYFNPLGFGRRLVMQAADVALWRVRGIPVLDRFAFGVGLLRADVSGAGSGEDYYHFASYYQVRMYAIDRLYLQYRQGLRTFNNRRGVYIDRTRVDADDASTHTLGVVGRYRGLTVGLHYTVNFEKAGEVDDDFLRLAVAYEF